MGVLREIKPVRNNEAIRNARMMCRYLETGEVTSIAFVAVKRGGTVLTGWDGIGGDTHYLVSGSATLAHRILKASCDD